MNDKTHRIRRSRPSDWPIIAVILGAVGLVVAVATCG